MNEIDISTWLVLNKDVIEHKLISRHNPHYHLLPGHIPELYIDNYENLVLKTIKEEISQSFNLTPEEILTIINKESIINILGNDILKPKE
jgi:hypothetical protein